MNKKGFTLIELMAVLVILALLATIIVPTITTSLRNAKDASKDAQINQIIKATKSWAAENASDLPITEGDKTVVTIGGLVSGGYLEQGIKNPVTGEAFLNCIHVEIKRYRNNYVYDVKDDDTELVDGCLPDYNPNAPTITLKGGSTIEVDISATEEFKDLDPGFVAKTAVGTTIPKDDVSIKYEKKNESGTYDVVSEIDLTTSGEYRVIYSVSAEGETISVKRKVIVRDKQPPVITVINPLDNTEHTSRFTMNITVGSTFTIPTATAYDEPNKEDLTSQVTTTSDVNTSVAGTYNVEYNVSDASGNIRTLKVVVIVE